MTDKNKLQIVEEHYVREWGLLNNLYTKRIVYIDSSGNLDFLRLRIDEKEYLKHYDK